MKSLRLAGTIALFVGLLAPATAHAQTQTPTLSLSVSKQQITYRDKVTVTAKLVGAEGTYSPVTIMATQLGMSPIVVKTAVPSATGTVTTTVKPAIKTTFVALYEGDETYGLARSAGKTVKVQARISNKVIGHDSKDGKWFIYRATPPQVLTTVAPTRPGAKIEAIAQYNPDNRWKTFDVVKATLDGNSQTGGVLTGVPGNYRIKTKFIGDEANTGASSKWTYIRLLQG